MKTTRIKAYFYLLTLCGLFSRPLPGQTRVDLLVRGGVVLTVNPQREIHEKGIVAIQGDRIVAVGSEEALGKKFVGKKVLHAAGRLVLPGLINTHTHVPMTLFRGIADDLALKDWLEKYIFPAEAKHVDREFVRWGTKLSALEMIRSGTTTFADMYYFEDDIAEAVAEAGLRAVLGETWIDFPAPDNRTLGDAQAYTEKFLARWKNHPLITAAVAPHSVYTDSPETLIAAKKMADRFQSPLLIHLAEAMSEIEYTNEKFRTTPLQHLNRIGFLDSHVIAAHCIYLSDEDLKIAVEKKIGCAHNPQSNMKTAAGVAPIGKFLRAGLAVGLGTDGAASNNDLNLFEEMDSAAKLQKMATGNPRAMTAQEVVEMATLGGARVLKMEKEIGSLEVGKRADIILIDLNQPHAVPLYDYYSHLVYAIKGSDVVTSIINGRVVMENRRVLTLNEAIVLQKAREFQQKIRSTLRRN